MKRIALVAALLAASPAYAGGFGAGFGMGVNDLSNGYPLGSTYDQALQRQLMQQQQQWFYQQPAQQQTRCQTYRDIAGTLHTNC